MNAEDVALRFVDAINRADVDGLAALMADDHVFVDSDGSRIAGRTTVAEAWSRYFSMMGAYQIEVHETYSSGDTVVLVGAAKGAWAGDRPPRPDAHWRVPAVWRAVVDADRVAVWQVFVNPEPILAARDTSSV